MPKGVKYGGRKAGTPNKVTSTIRNVLSKTMDDYFMSKQFAEDIVSLEPKERVAIMEKLLQYAVPKLQATTLDVATEKKKTIEDTLIALSEEEESK